VGEAADGGASRARQETRLVVVGGALPGTRYPPPALASFPSMASLAPPSPPVRTLARGDGRRRCTTLKSAGQREWWIESPLHPPARRGDWFGSYAVGFLVLTTVGGLSARVELNDNCSYTHALGPSEAPAPCSRSKSEGLEIDTWLWGRWLGDATTQAVEDLCVHKKADGLYSNLKAVCDEHIKGRLASLQVGLLRKSVGRV